MALNGTTFLLISCLFTNRKTEGNYQKWFQYLQKEGLDLSELNVMTDLEFGISKAGVKVWPTSTWNLCYFHVLMNSGDKMEELKIPKRIQFLIKKEIASIHSKTTEEEARSIWKDFKEGLLFLSDPQVSHHPIRNSISKW